MYLLNNVMFQYQKFNNGLFICPNDEGYMEKKYLMCHFDITSLECEN